MVPLIGPEDTIARLHAAVGTVNAGMLQNVRESIVRRVTKCTEVGQDYLNIFCKYKLRNLFHVRLASVTEIVFTYRSFSI
jgi:hypothetical protein